MKGNVFQCHGESLNKQQFLKTLGVLEEHINKTLKHSKDVMSICKTLEVVELTQPENLTKEEHDNDMGKRLMWELSIKTYMRRMDTMADNIITIYSIVWGQCSPMMQSKIASLDGYKAKSDESDCVWLIKEIQGITHRFEGTRNVFISLDDAWCSYYGCQQGAQQSLHDYLKEYQSIVQVLEH